MHYNVNFFSYDFVSENHGNFHEKIYLFNDGKLFAQYMISSLQPVYVNSA